MGARVNGRLVPLESTLDNGDVVEIFTSRVDAGPSRDWLTFVKSPRARNKIRAWFSKERREEAVEQGKDAIAKAMRKQHLPIQRLMSHEGLWPGQRDALRRRVVAVRRCRRGGTSRRSPWWRSSSAPSAARRAPPRHRRGDHPVTGGPPPAHRRPGRRVKGADDVWVKLARCCTPVPGDSIVASSPAAPASRAPGGLRQRRRPRAEPDRIQEVEWDPGSGASSWCRSRSRPLDRSRLLSDVTPVLSDNHVSILSAQVTTSRDRVAVSKFTFEMADATHLDHVLNAVRRVDGVFDVYRITAAGRPEPTAARRPRSWRRTRRSPGRGPTSSASSTSRASAPAASTALTSVRPRPG